MSFIQDFKRKVYRGDNIMSLSDIRYLPRWVILLLDIFIVFMAILIAYYIAKRFAPNSQIFLDTFQVILFIITISLLFMYVFKTYSGIIRHSTFIDLFKIFLAIACTILVVGFVNSAFFILGEIKLITPSFAFLALFGALSCTFLFLFRLAVKEAFHFAREFRRSTLKKKLLVVGVGEQSIAMARAVLDNPSLPYDIVGFITQRNDSNLAKLLGKRIFTREKLEKLHPEDLEIDGALLVKEIMSREEIDSWVTLFLEKGIQIFKAPSVQKLRESDSQNTIKNLQIEDLLNRRPIKITNEEVKKRHFGKAILVTGGAGSIGSEIVRQVAMFEPELLVVLDQGETPLYEIELEMRQKFPVLKMKFVMIDISNRCRLEQLFEKYQFSMVYHAAAYKHVPLVEENPHEGVLVNVMGTKNVASLASKYKVNRFVMVSTDKAVNPTNVMGATKRTAELFVQALQNTENNTTKFITTRFGNVLGSNGSVIPHFKKQIEAGGPVTITHPDIVRYFMTIPEACELVLEAGTMGKGGEIFVFDMGEPVKILDLARRMIKLSGLVPNEDIQIVYTGLRPGEKLYEELLSDDTRTLPTHHEKIMISKDPSLTFLEIDGYINDLLIEAEKKDKKMVVKVLKSIVPEFKSNNSVYELLDAPN